jgi:hypothetical protein
MALIKIILGCLLTMALFWFSLKFYGESQRFIAYDHPLEQEAGPWVMAYGGESSAYPSHTFPAIEASLRNPKNWLAFDVFMSAERSFYLIPRNYIAKEDKRPWVKWNDREIAMLDAGADFKSSEGTYPYKGIDLQFPKLETVIAKYPEAKFFLWFRDNERDLDLIIASFLKRFPKLENRVLIYSEYDVVMRSLKEQLPRWVYGSADGERTRLLMFDALRLQSAATIKGDFYFTPLKSGSVKMISETIKHEIERRQLPLILGPLMNDSEVNDAVKLSPKGFITTDSSHLNKVLSELGSK